MDNLPKILIVDDRPENLLAMKVLLADTETELFMANSGNEALSLTLDHEFALILLDVQMPGMDGYEVAGILQDDDKSSHVPIIFVTANYPSEQNIFEGYKQGAMDYIIKPIIPEILKSKVNILLDLYRYNREILDETEWKYKNIFENISDAVFLIDDKKENYGKILETNLTAVHITKLDQDQLLGKSFYSLFLNKDYIEDQFVSLQSGMVSRFEQTLINKIGKEIPVELRVHHYTHRQKAMKMIIMQDISDWKKQEASLKEARDKAEAANESKNLFLANVSHELRTPLNGIYGMVQLLLKTGLTEEQMEYIKLLNDSGFNLKTLIDDLLDVAQLESKELKITSSNFNLFETVKNSVEMCRLKAEEKNLQLKLTIGSDISNQLIVRGDRSRFSQILLNLITNSIKYSKKGKIDISIERNEESDTDIFIIKVKDTGIGIPDDMQGKIFNRFTQLEHTYRKTQKGVGLGLAIVKNLVQLMQGSISVVSKVGTGSEFTLKLPFIVGGQDVKPANNLSEAEPDLSGTRILLAEDEGINALFFQRMLKAENCECTLARNGLEVLEHLEKGEFDIILMDLGMPVMDGLTATKEIRKQKKYNELPIVALTAYAYPEDIEKCLAAGMNDFLTKPVENNVLLNKIKMLRLVRD